MSPLFSPVSLGGIGKATVTATTGSPTIDSSTRAGKTIYKFTGSGSITIGTAGTAEVLVIGGGGSGGNTYTTAYAAGGGGAGGYIYDTGVVLTAGTYTVTVGAGGAGSTGGAGYSKPGVSSAIYKATNTGIFAFGGGAGGGGGNATGYFVPGNPGGSGGGSLGNGNSGLGTVGQGNNGGLNGVAGADNSGGAVSYTHLTLPTNREV